MSERTDAMRRTAQRHVRRRARARKQELMFEMSALIEDTYEELGLAIETPMRQMLTHLAEVGPIVVNRSAPKRRADRARLWVGRVVLAVSYLATAVLIAIIIGTVLA